MPHKASFLSNIIDIKRRALKKILSDDPDLCRIKEKAQNVRSSYDLYSALGSSDYLSLIAEIKRASPSKGPIKTHLDVPYQAKIYQSYGASALSVLTEERFFNGSLEDLSNARQVSSLPILRKDFIFHPYQVYEAKAYGADAILLIASVLCEKELIELVDLAIQLGMQTLVEVHNEQEIYTALRSKTKIIGINNRDLDTFQVDLNTTARLAPFIPKDRFLVSESGIKGDNEAKRVASWGAKGILVGEALVTSNDLNTLMGKLTRIKCAQE